jgi:hypothetical protein
VKEGVFPKCRQNGIYQKLTENAIKRIIQQKTPPSVKNALFGRFPV